MTSCSCTSQWSGGSGSKLSPWCLPDGQQGRIALQRRAWGQRHARHDFDWSRAGLHRRPVRASVTTQWALAGSGARTPRASASSSAVHVTLAAAAIATRADMARWPSMCPCSSISRGCPSPCCSREPSMGMAPGSLIDVSSSVSGTTCVTQPSGPRTRLLRDAPYLIHFTIPLRHVEYWMKLQFLVILR